MPGRHPERSTLHVEACNLDQPLTAVSLAHVRETFRNLFDACDRVIQSARKDHDDIEIVRKVCCRAPDGPFDVNDPPLSDAALFTAAVIAACETGVNAEQVRVEALEAVVIHDHWQWY